MCSALLWSACFRVADGGSCQVHQLAGKATDSMPVWLEHLVVSATRRAQQRLDRCGLVRTSRTKSFAERGKLPASEGVKHRAQALISISADLKSKTGSVSRHQKATS